MTCWRQHRHRLIGPQCWSMNCTHRVSGPAAHQHNLRHLARGSVRQQALMLGSGTATALIGDTAPTSYYFKRHKTQGVWPPSSARGPQAATLAATYTVAVAASAATVSALLPVKYTIISINLVSGQQVLSLQHHTGISISISNSNLCA